MKSDYTTNSRYITHTIAFWKVGRIHFLSSGVKGLIWGHKTLEFWGSYSAVPYDSWPHWHSLCWKAFETPTILFFFFAAFHHPAQLLVDNPVFHHTRRRSPPSSLATARHGTRAISTVKWSQCLWTPLEIFCGIKILIWWPTREMWPAQWSVFRRLGAVSRTLLHRKQPEADHQSCWPLR